MAETRNRNAGTGDCPNNKRGGAWRQGRGKEREKEGKGREGVGGGGRADGRQRGAMGAGPRKDAADCPTRTRQSCCHLFFFPPILLQALNPSLGLSSSLLNVYIAAICTYKPWLITLRFSFDDLPPLFHNCIHVTK